MMTSGRVPLWGHARLVFPRNLITFATQEEEKR